MSVIPKTILLVENEVVVALYEARQLQEEGYAVVHAYSGAEAIAKVTAAQPAIDLILMAINLGGGLDGVEAAQIILQDHDIPVVFLSLYIGPEVVAKTEKITSYGYVEKGARITVLSASIKMAFKLHAAHQAIQRANESLRLEIAERKQAEEVIQKISDRLDFALASANLGIWELSLVDLTAWRSSRHDEIFGYKALLPEWTFDIFIEHVVPEDRGQVREKFQQALATRTEWNFECLIRRIDGVLRWIWAKGVPRYDEKNEPVSMFGIVQDITEHKQTEEALRESRQRLQGLFETMTEGVILIAPDGQIVQANAEAERILGLERSEIKARHYIAPEWDILRPDGTRMPPDEMAGPRAMKEMRPVKDVIMGVRHPDSSISWINVSAVPLMNDAGKLDGVVGTFTDITKHKQAEDALRLDALHLQIQAELHQLIDAPERQLLDFIVEALTRTVESQFAFFGLLDGAETEMIIYTWSKDAMGQCAVSDQPLHFPIATAGLWGECVRQRRPIWVNDYAIAGRHGYPSGHVPIQNFIAVPIFDGARIVAVAAAANKTVDYDDHDSAALTILADRIWGILRRKRVEAALQQALAEKEMLMRELQHRVKNSFATAASLIDLERDHLLDAHARAIFVDMQTRLLTIAALYDQLNQGGRIDRIDLRGYLYILVETLAQAYLAAEGPVKIETRFAALELDPKRAMSLGLIVNELVTNALKYAFPAGRSGVIRVELAERADGAMLCVADNGVGLALSLSRVNGSGMGLKLVEMLARQLDGALTVESEQGVTVRVTFGK